MHGDSSDDEYDESSSETLDEENSFLEYKSHEEPLSASILLERFQQFCCPEDHSEHDEKHSELGYITESTNSCSSPQSKRTRHNTEMTKMEDSSYSPFHTHEPIQIPLLEAFQQQNTQDEPSIRNSSSSEQQHPNALSLSDTIPNPASNLNPDQENSPELDGDLSFASLERGWRDKCCEICYMVIVSPCFLECGHIYCMPCMEQFAMVVMNAGTVQDLACPHCTQRLSHFDLSCILSSADYERYMRIAESNYTRRQTNEIWCPQLDCKGVVSNGPGTSKWGTCPECNFVFCKKCRSPSHKGQSCKRAKRKNKTVPRSDHSTRKWASKHTKPCPRCHEIIQKQGGCHHMFCPTCAYIFCWICGKDANDGPFHCQGRKTLAIIGGIVASPVLLVGGAVVGVAYLAESRLIRRGNHKECVTYNAATSVGAKLGLGLYWIID